MTMLAAANGGHHVAPSAYSCMAEYDLCGWTVPDLVNPDDVSALR
ncbi:MAG TPA: hypothetical protein VJR70_02140 [Stellaceae bacterium]|nr:hypothetical protein [Stellaceae bacterium]